jgi:hypothetical protein
MFITYLRSKFRMRNSNVSLVIAIKPTKENIRTAAILLFYILQKNYINKI